RAREVRRELVRPQMRRQIGEPPGAGELGDPDAIEHVDVGPRAPALEVDDVELVLIVRGPRQRRAVDADPWMWRLERAQKPGQRIGAPEDAGILEHEGDGPALRRAAEAAAQRQ